MGKVTFKGNVIQTAGSVPAVGSKAPDFTLTGTDLSDVKCTSFKGRNVVLNIFPSIDTPVCAASVKRFNQEAATLADTVVLCVSVDLPFAHGRFCEAEGIKNVQAVSAFRSPGFGDDYGVRITSSALSGLFARAIVIIGKDGLVKYTQLVPEIAQDPDFAAAIRALKA